jgi:hypothetical protein
VFRRVHGRAPHAWVCNWTDLFGTPRKVTIGGALWVTADSNWTDLFDTPGWESAGPGPCVPTSLRACSARMGVQLDRPLRHAPESDHRWCTLGDRGQQLDRPLRHARLGERGAGALCSHEFTGVLRTHGCAIGQASSQRRAVAVAGQEEGAQLDRPLRHAPESDHRWCTLGDRGQQSDRPLRHALDTTAGGGGCANGQASSQRAHACVRN